MDSTTIGWLNFASLIVFSVMFSVLYVLSVRPAHLEQKIGEKAYQRCARYRMILLIPMGIVTLNYVIYPFYPLPIDPFPERFPWSYWVNVIVAVLAGVPLMYVFVRGVIDAGSEAMIPEKKNTMYGGIYQKIRHPQALGEAPMFILIGWLLNSPFLTIFSLIFLPVWYWWCVEEEKDLLLRYGDSYAEYVQRTGMFFPKRSNL